MHGLSRKARSLLRRERRQQQAGELNLVPMIDILVVLVFFLLVNSTGVSILGINLPDSTQKIAPEIQPLPLIVTVRSDGLALTEGATELGRFGTASEGYDFQALSEKLLAVKDARPDEKSITLLMEASVSHNTLVQTMDAVRITAVNNGRNLRELFPNISLGDAPVLAAAAEPVAAEVLP